MRKSLIAKLIGIFLLSPMVINSSLSKNIANEVSINQLEEILNQKKNYLLKDLFLHKSFKKFNKNLIDFRKNYKDIKWSIKIINDYSDKKLLDIK